MRGFDSCCPWLVNLLLIIKDERSINIIDLNKIHVIKNKPFKPHYNNRNNFNTPFRKWRFRTRPFNALFHCFKQKTITKKTQFTTLSQKNQTNFFFTRFRFSSNLFLQSTLPFERIFSDVLWFKIVNFSTSSSHKLICFTLPMYNFFFYIRYLKIYWQYVFIFFYKHYHQWLWQFWSTPFYSTFWQKQLNFLLKNSFWTFVKLVPNSHCSLSTVGDYFFDKFSFVSQIAQNNTRLNLSASFNFTKKIKTLSITNKTATATLRYPSFFKKQILYNKNFWFQFFFFKQLKQKINPNDNTTIDINLNKQQQYLLFKRQGLPIYLYFTSSFSFIKHFKKQVAPLKKKTNNDLYFYFFDSFNFVNVHTIEATTRIKNWNFADIPVNLIDEMFYVLFVNSNASYFMKYQLCLSQNVAITNNSFFENKYSFVLRKIYTTIKPLFTRYKKYSLLKKFRIKRKKKPEPLPKKFFFKWKPRRKKKKNCYYKK